MPASATLGKRRTREAHKGYRRHRN